LEMERIARKLAVSVTIVLGALLLGGWVCSRLAPAFYATVVERIRGESPQAKVAAYVHAVAWGDEEAAFAVWELPDWGERDAGFVALRERRQQVTDTLIAAGINPTFTVLHIEWWGTCCEPRVISDPHEAGGARLRVKLLPNDGPPLVYIFDVFVRGGAYWGGAANYPPRRWVLRDVYPQDQSPLFWRWVSEPTIHYLP